MLLWLRRTHSMTNKQLLLYSLSVASHFDIIKDLCTKIILLATYPDLAEYFLPVPWCTHSSLPYTVLVCFHLSRTEPGLMCLSKVPVLLSCSWMLSVVCATTGCLVLANELTRRETGTIFYQQQVSYHLLASAFQSVLMLFQCVVNRMHVLRKARVSTIGNKV